jgi:glycosyltransferase involved in cell wall biosynthesis
LDFIGSDELRAPELLANPRIRFLNLKGDQNPDTGVLRKMGRVIAYYARLVAYAAAARPRIFHILWNNKFLYFDRTILMGYYKLLGKRVTMTVHNVNAGIRDGTDSLLNRQSLRCQYRLCDHLFVHTERMKQELLSGFGVTESKVSVIPFGINSTVPVTNLTPAQARSKLGLSADDKAILFFGNIAPYKGLEYLAATFVDLARTDPSYRLIIAGRPKGAEVYWRAIERTIDAAGLRDQVLFRIEYVPDEETELYFKAADVLVLPYTQIFQSGVLFLGYNFGLPVIAADVGSLKEDIIEDETGLVCRPCDSADLARAIRRYFDSELYVQLDRRRPMIRAHARERYSWGKVAEITIKVYRGLMEMGTSQ